MQVNSELELLNALEAHQPDITIINHLSLTQEISIDYQVKISSPTYTSLTRDICHVSSLFNITPSGDLTLSNIILNGNNNSNISTPLIINNNRLSLYNTMIVSAISTSSGAGLYCSESATYTYIKDTHFNSCISHQNGGAIYFSGNGSLRLTNVSLRENQATLGGAIYCQQPSNQNFIDLNICDFSYNKATSGGAIYLNQNCHLNINNHNTFENNTATLGKDIYNKGQLYLVRHNIILTGLYLYDENSLITIIGDIIGSYILLEKSNYLNPTRENSPIIFAKAMEEHPFITEEDLLVFRKPKEDFENWTIQKNHDNSVIELKFQEDGNPYIITYTNLQGAINNNPTTYTQNDTPFLLQNPLLEGYTFTGWLDEDHQPITEISTGSIGDRDLKATWKRTLFYEIDFNSNTQDVVNNMPVSQTVDAGDNLIIPDNIPTRRGYIFLHWNTSQNNTGITYFPKETMTDIQKDQTLYAIWYKVPAQCISPINYYCICCKCRKHLKDICPCGKYSQTCSCKK